MPEGIAVNLVESVAVTVDDVLDNVVGFRVAEPAIELVKPILPANVIHNVTGIPKPSELIESVVDRITSLVR